MRWIAEKYVGEVLIEQEEGNFVVTVIINLEKI